jgi:hypothetical protein
MSVPRGITLNIPLTIQIPVTPVFANFVSVSMSLCNFLCLPVVPGLHDMARMQANGMIHDSQV